MLIEIFAFINLLFTGLLAGEEFVICYGLRSSISALDAESGIRLRQDLIRKLRILVTSMFFSALLSGIVVVLFCANRPGEALRWAGVFFLVVFISITLGGTVPINKAALAWEPGAPPDGWRFMISRWERLDVARTWAAIGAFSLFLGGGLFG